MSVTNEERHEMARKLRELPTDMYEVEELWEMKGLDTCCKDQTDYYLIHFAIFGCFPADHIEPEPERTCHIKLYNCTDSLGQKMHRCSECGALMTDDACFFEGELDIGGFSYCPNCGAKVVDV